jgi:NAD(P)H-flavin reductase
VTTPATSVLEPMLPSPFVVVDRARETADTVSLRVESTENPSNEFKPGQFSMLYAIGVGEVPISISGDPESAVSLEYTIRSVGGVTNALCDLAPGDALGVRGPYGKGWPIGEAADRDLLIIAGGIGLAPLRPVILHALAHRDRYRSLSLLYGARTPNDLLFTGLLDDWRRRSDIDVEVTVDRGDAGWAGDVGVVTQLVTRATFEPGRTTVLLCGPEVMMRAAARRMRADGIDRADIFVSLERNMQCGIGLCGHCQLGSAFVCYDGPIFSYDRAGRWLEVGEL